MESTEKPLGQLIRESIEMVNRMTPEQREEMHREQRRSFIRAEAGFGSDRDEAEYAEALSSGNKIKLAELEANAKARIDFVDKWMAERGL